MIDYTTYATGRGNHAYEVGTNAGRFIVHASTRSQAASILKRDGYTVRDVNLIG